GGVAGRRPRRAQGGVALLRERAAALRGRGAGDRRAAASPGEPGRAHAARGCEDRRVRVRAATPADLPTLERLWRDFCAEVPPPEFEDDDADEELREVAEIVSGEIALVAEDEDGTPVGFVLARRAGERLGRVTDLYVVPGARRTGVARALVREAAERLRAHGLEAVDLDVMAGNAVARAVYAHWGFREEVLRLVARLDELAPRLEADVEAPTRGVVYVQTDDFVAVERAVTAFAPRIGSRRSHVEPPVEGWTRVRDEVAEREPG